MSLSLNTNITSIAAQYNLQNSQTALSNSMSRLSSGSQINKASDNAAGLAIATHMNSQIMGMSTAINNANDANSMLQTADGTMGAITNNVQTIRNLAVQASNGALSNTDRASIQVQVDQLTAQNNQFAATAKYNGVSLLNNSSTLSFQVGANAGDSMSVDFTQFKMSALTSGNVGVTTTVAGVTSTTNTVDVTTAASASTAITNMDTDLSTISSSRAALGSYENRLTSVIANLQSTSTNTQAAMSSIQDTNYASETANMTKNQILTQAGVAMLSQANSMPQAILKLIG
jgi:flagellin